MTTDDSFPDLIANRAAAALRSTITGIMDPSSVATVDRLVQHSVRLAFGCTCPLQTDNSSAGSRQETCPLHGVSRRVREHDEAVMPSQAMSWEEDPYYDHTTAERREDVQAGLRAAAEVGRTFRAELAATARRGDMARERLGTTLEHASFNGGLTHSELELAEMALSAVQYALRLLYVAGNHVGDQASADQRH